MANHPSISIPSITLEPITGVEALEFYGVSEYFKEKYILSRMAQKTHGDKLAKFDLDMWWFSLPDYRKKEVGPVLDHLIDKTNESLDDLFPSDNRKKAKYIFVELFVTWLRVQHRLELIDMSARQESTGWHFINEKGMNDIYSKMSIDIEARVLGDFSRILPYDDPAIHVRPWEWDASYVPPPKDDS